MYDVTDRATHYIDRLPKPADFYGADSPEGLIRDLLKQILKDDYEGTIERLEFALDESESDKEDLDERLNLVSDRYDKLLAVLATKEGADFGEVLARAKALVSKAAQ
jgi:hypothetical protein